MLKIIISGCNGRMGQTVMRLATEDDSLEIVAGFDINTVKLSSFPVYADPMEYGGSADVVIDFSSTESLDGLLSYCVAKNLPVVLCTTGHSADQIERIDATSKLIPVFRSANMSLGINLVADLIRKAAAVLGSDFDVEIVEKHHSKKVDAPSGTAILLADVLASSLPYEANCVYERQSRRAPREKNEIGISSVRGGTIVGEHEVIFAGVDEVIEIKHTAFSREVFAVGALRAAKFIAGISVPGLYDMQDMMAKI